MQWYASLLQFAEFSTIFLNLRQWILTAGYTSTSKISSIISLLFFISFFIVRVIPLPWLIQYWITKDYRKLANEKGTPLAVANTMSLSIHVLLQTFWFILMVKKMISMIFGRKKKTTTKKDE